METSKPADTKVNRQPDAHTKRNTKTNRHTHNTHVAGSKMQKVII